MASAIGWYGPLIDLSRAASHIDDFVQLLVFVHRCSPVQYKLSKGGEVVRTDIQVGDETRPFFSVSLWQKQMGSMAVAGDIVLLQNVKITSFGGIVEARTVQYSSLRCLIHPFESLVSKGVDELIGHCEVGFTMKEKLRKVVEWAKQAGSTIRRVKLPNPQVGQQLSINWNVPEERKSWNCLSLLEVSRLTNSCKAIFYASVGEIFLPLNDRALGEVDKENMFIRRRLSLTGDANVVEDFICTGCQLCGSPLDSEHGSRLYQNCVPLYCQKSTNRLHVVGLIYRPFMLYVWDELEYIPLLVTNKAAELLFGNIRAERVYSCHERQPGEDRNAAREGDAGLCSSDADKSVELGKYHKCSRNMKFDLIWLILLRMLLQQGKNSPLKFEVDVNPCLDMENGRFEMVSMSLPCCRTQVSPD